MQLQQVEGKRDTVPRCFTWRRPVPAGVACIRRRTGQPKVQKRLIGWPTLGHVNESYDIHLLVFVRLCDVDEEEYVEHRHDDQHHVIQVQAPLI